MRKTESGAGINLMLVEDDPAVARTLGERLVKEGFTVRTLESGASAVAAAEAAAQAAADAASGAGAERFDLVLMDIDLGPDMDGPTAAAAILARLDLPVVFLTTHPEREIADAAEAVSAYGYVPKNAGHAILVASIRMALKLHRSQTRLGRSEGQYRLLFENLSAGFAVHRMVYAADGSPADYRFLAVNPAFERLTGLRAADMVGRTVLEALPDTERYWIDTYAEVVRTGRPLAYRNYSRALDRHFDVWAFRSAPGEFATVINDITDQVRTEERLAASEARFRALFETMNQGAIFHDADGAITYANPAAVRVLGLSLDQLQGKTSLDPGWKSIRRDGSDLPGEEHPAMIALRTGEPVLGAVFGVFQPQLGQHRWLEVDAVPLFADGEAKPASVYAIFTDITDRVVREETQKFLGQRGWDGTGEDFFRSLARFLAEALGADYVCIDRLEGDALIARTVAVWRDGGFDADVSYTLAQTPCGQAVGKSVCLYPRDVRRLFPDDAALQELEAEGYVATTLWGGDAPIGLIALIFRRPLADSRLAETVLGLVAARAAGELQRRDAADALRRHVDQIATLMKELQHRVKNNLNVVSGLLDLEANGVADAKARAVFMDARNRIQSMSAIYERLYLSDDLATVEVGPYLADLARSIFAAYRLGDGRVRLEIAAGNVKLGTKKVVPIGLIVNELISNALKYAFPDGRSGTLTVGFAVGNGRAVLDVADDGVGFPAGVDPETAGSLGLVLVRMLAEELGAELAFAGPPGSSVRIAFPL
jgi:PAS domain S-box-containing protein